MRWKWRYQKHFRKKHRKKAQRKQFICPKCGQEAQKTRHHVFPKRWNKTELYQFPSELRDVKVGLCRHPCHDAIEVVIREKEEDFGGRLPIYEYPKIVNEFVGFEIC